MILNYSFLNRNIPQIELKAGYKVSLLSRKLDKKYPVIEFLIGENLNTTELGRFNRAGLD